MPHHDLVKYLEYGKHAVLDTQQTVDLPSKLDMPPEIHMKGHPGYDWMTILTLILIIVLALAISIWCIKSKVKKWCNRPTSLHRGNEDNIELTEEELALTEMMNS